MVFSTALVLTSLFSLGLSSPLATPGMQVQGSRSSPPSGFTLNGPAEPGTRLDLRIALKQTNIQGLVTTLYDISDPENPRYGNWLSTDEVCILTDHVLRGPEYSSVLQISRFSAPSTATVEAVSRWLASHNVSSSFASPSGDWIQINVDVEKANAMLDANFSAFEHATSGSTLVRTLTYSVPSNISNDIIAINPTTRYVQRYP